ncbi:thioesterase II family protein [Kitasatospora terrestris]|uniref:Alpha/beta fold hydrolase n=1 Tax=Kitasatospora terrestris TaxID=258051 RepID=A0ABP9D9W9_9ACTN
MNTPQPSAGTARSAGYLRLAGRNRLTDRKWIARPRRVADPRLRVVCFPHIGGGAALYNGWTGRLPADTELCAVRLPGRENRVEEPLVDELPVLLDGIEGALAPLLDRPYVLFGHCSGSMLAFQLARRLRAAGRRMPSLLVVSSIEAPAVREITDPMHVLPREELFRRFADYGGIAPSVLADPDLMALFEPVIRADYRLIERLAYHPEPPLDVPLTVIGGLHDPVVEYGAMTHWRAETSRPFSLRLVDAGHFVVDEAADLVARMLAELSTEENQ